MSMFVDLIGESYLVVRNYITEDRAITEAGKFRDAYQAEGLDASDGAGVYTNAIGMYQQVNGLVLLSEKVAELSELLGSSVLPTYSYSRSYFTDGILGEHKDRPSCEITCTVHLDSDEPWDLQIYNVAGDLVDISLNPGDALIFDGVNYTHNRLGKYSGKEYTQAFLHYVFAHGDQSQHFFDLGVGKKNAPELSHYINQYDNFIPESVCDGIVNAAIDIDDWTPAGVVGEEEPGERQHRVCEMLATVNHKELDQLLFTHINKVITEYCMEHEHIDVSVDEGYSILKYKPGGKYDTHTDHGREHNRAITIILNLNDDYEGGGLSLLNNTHKVKLKKGDAVIFPSSFVYDHCIHPITKGTRYSVVTWAV